MHRRLDGETVTTEGLTAPAQAPAPAGPGRLP